MSRSPSPDGSRVAHPGPGAPAYDDAVRLELTAALRSRGNRYRPRTRHLDQGAPRYTNRLIREPSPYLLQHAHNPVSWYPWSEEAFAAAGAQDKPVFLSVGYSTCHWCHVMEEESFEDVEIAKLLNERFVSIKVDREERPDVDAIYMAAVMGLTGRGGWPMTVFMTPDKRPFFGGTYFPARDGDRGGSRGFLTLLQGIEQAWREDRANIERATREIIRAVEAQLAPPPPAEGPDEHTTTAVLRFYEERFDAHRGGLSVRQKFPSSFPNRLMLRLARRLSDDDERDALLGRVKQTLDAMADGGIHDQVGGGFHRYATDPDWLVPHFEKMLYDNAQLGLAYVEGWQALGEARYREVAEDLLAYVERDMTSSEGAFYSATDADSLSPEGHREEGYFFTWTPGELEAELGHELAEVAVAFYDVRPGGNFEGRSILHRPRTVEEVAALLGLSNDQLRASVRLIRDRLVDARGERPPPLRDEKILTAWNGLMISAFARAGLAFGVRRYVDVASRAARFLLDHAEVEWGSSSGPAERRLCRVVKDGEARVNAYLDDHAALLGGLLDVFVATGVPSWLQEAERLAARVEAHFLDGERGGYFLTAADHETLLVREKPAHDGAEPSGASLHAQNLVRLALLTDDERYRRAVERTLGAYGEVWKRAPHALTEMLIGWDLLRADHRQLVIVGKNRAALDPFLDVTRPRFLPDATLIAVDEEAAAALSPRVPALRDRGVLGGEATAYLCRGTVCELPARTPAALAEQLDLACGSPAAEGVR